MSELIDTTEMYLRTILELEEEGVPAMRARIVERLRHSGPTVSQTVARMERDGLLSLDDERQMVLTPAGRIAAVRVMRKHRLAERLLHDVLGLDWAQVHDEACRWEHVMSEQVEHRILAMVQGPMVSPYGNPIPGLDELGLAAGEGPDPTDPVLGEIRGPSRVTVLRLGEAAQVHPEQLAVLAEGGVRPGAVLAAEPGEDGDVVVRVEDSAGKPAEEETRAIVIPAALAAHIRVVVE